MAIDTKQILKSSHLFSSFNSLEILKVTEIARREFLSKGDIVINEGENFEIDASLYVIASGLMKVSMPLGIGKELVLSILSPPDHFGELSFVDENPRSADVVAMEDTELLRIGHEPLKGLLESDPGLALKFYKSLCSVVVHKLRNMNEKLKEGHFHH